MAIHSRTLRFETLETRCLLDGTTWVREVEFVDRDVRTSTRLPLLVDTFSPRLKNNVHHNFILPGDVDRDGTLNPSDVMTLINHINAGTGLVDPAPGVLPNNFMDVTDDHKLAPDDALTVINLINAELTEPALIDVTHSRIFEEELLSHAAQPIEDDCSDDPNDVQTLLTVHGSYEGVLTAAEGKTEAVVESIRLDGGNNKEAWGMRKYATSTLVLQGWGSISVTIDAGAVGYSHEASCATSTPWIDTETQFGLAQLTITAQGNFSIVLTVTAGLDVVGTDDYVLSPHVDRIGNSLSEFTHLRVVVDADYSVVSGTLFGDSSNTWKSPATTIDSFGTAGLSIQAAGVEPFIATLGTYLVSSQAFLPNITGWQDENYREAKVTLFSVPRASLTGKLLGEAAYGKAADSFSVDIAQAELNKTLISVARDNSDPAAIAAHDAIFAERGSIVNLLFPHL